MLFKGNEASITYFGVFLNCHEKEIGPRFFPYIGNLEELVKDVPECETEARPEPPQRSKMKS